jgi:hypothetical protein
MRVCIIGAGVAGLQCADVLANEHECHVFDSSGHVGGVWRNNYDGFGLQVPAELYEFVGHPNPLYDGQFPPGKTVHACIQEFVKRTCLEQRVDFHLGETVTTVCAAEGGGWDVTTQTCESVPQSYRFDYCVVCTGMYNTPHLPADAPDGAMHTSQFVDASIARGKRVVVVGGGKSAIDCAVAAARHAETVTLVAKRLHWPVPRRILGIVPFKWGTYSRLGHFLLPAHWDMPPKARRIHQALSGVKWIAWRILEQVFAWQFALRQNPPVPLEVDLFGGGQILTYELRDLVASGKITLAVGESLKVPPADLTVYGTGFGKSYSMLESCDLDVRTDGLWLYKNIIPVRVPRLAFVGSEVSTFNNILTQRIQAEWLARWMDRHNAEADDVRMDAYVEAERVWKRSWMPFSTSRASLVQLHMTHYHDSLCRDIQWPLPKTRWWQWFLPITARDYGRIS